jgi:HNH endonuclease
MRSQQQEINSRWDFPSGYEGDFPPDWNARRQTVYKRNNWTCTRCGQQSGPHASGDGVRLYARHQVPSSDGGSNALSNLTTLCEPCHDEVHDHDIFGDGWIGDDPAGVLWGATKRGLGIAGVVALVSTLDAYLIGLSVTESFPLTDPVSIGILGGVCILSFIGTLRRPRVVCLIYGALTVFLAAYVMDTVGLQSGAAVLFGILAGLPWVLISGWLWAGSFARRGVYDRLRSLW